MRNLIIGVAAAVMAMAMPSLASADVKATVGVQYTHLDSDSFADNPDIWGLNGAFSSDMGGWTLQADGNNDRASTSGFHEGLSYGAVSAGMRNDQYAIYGSVGLQNFDGETAPSIAIGGQLYLNNIVLDGSVSYLNFDDSNIDGTDIAVDASYFFNDNLSVSARYSHLDLNNSGPNDNLNTWGVGAEYRFDNSPLSVNVGYRQNDESPDDVKAWTIGLTWDLGSDSLRDRATHGPSFNAERTLYQDVTSGF